MQAQKKVNQRQKEQKRVREAQLTPLHEQSEVTQMLSDEEGAPERPWEVIQEESSKLTQSVFEARASEQHQAGGQPFGNRERSLSGEALRGTPSANQGPGNQVARKEATEQERDAASIYPRDESELGSVWRQSATSTSKALAQININLGKKKGVQKLLVFEGDTLESSVSAFAKKHNIAKEKEP